MSERWQAWLQTGEAVAELLVAKALIITIAVRDWQSWLGHSGPTGPTSMAQARVLASHVHRAAARLPCQCKCLPRAMALSRMLKRRRIVHKLAIAVRPATKRQGTDDLHAWVEVEGQVILGDLPGPWVPIHVLP